MGEGNTTRYKPYPAYRRSGVEWLGDIPEGWDAIQIRHLTTVKRGASPRPIDSSRYFDEEGEYAWTRIADVTASDVYLLSAPQRLSKLGSSLSVPLEVDELFLSIAGTVGKPCITGIKACIHDGFVYFPELTIPNKFLFYIFAGEQAYKGLGKFGTQLNLNTETVGGIKIGLPTDYEMSNIVCFLDHETGKIDGLLAKQERLIELLEEKRQAVISHAVTKGLAPNAPLRPSGIDWLGDVPAHWEVLSLKRVVSLKGGYAFSSESFADIGKKVIRIGDIDTYGNVSLENAKCIPIAMANRFNEYEVRTGHILMAMTGATIGKAGWYLNQEPALLNQRVGAFECDEGHIGSRFFWYILKSDGYQKYVTLTAFGGAQPNISDTQMLSYSIVLPALVEQEMISNFLDSENITFDELTLKAQSAITLLKERRTALISAAVTGKVDVRDWQPPKPISGQEPMSAKDAEL